MHNYLMGRIGVDLELLAQCAHRGKRITGTQLARNHCFLCRVHDLLVKRNTRPKLHAKRNHVRTISHSTHNRPRRLPEKKENLLSHQEHWPTMSRVQGEPLEGAALSGRRSSEGQGQREKRN